MEHFKRPNVLGTVMGSKCKNKRQKQQKKSKIKKPRDTLYERTSKADEAQRLHGSCIQWQIVASVRFAYYCAARLSTA